MCPCTWQAGTWQIGSRAMLILNLEIRCRSVFSFTYREICLWEKKRPCTEWTVRGSNDGRHEIFLSSKPPASWNKSDGRRRECRSKLHAVGSTMLRKRVVLGSDLGHDIGLPYSLRCVDQATYSSFDIFPNSLSTTISTFRRSVSQPQLQLLLCPTPQTEREVQSTNDPVPRATPSLYVGYSESKYRLRISLAHRRDCHFAHVQCLPLSTEKPQTPCREIRVMFMFVPAR